MSVWAAGGDRTTVGDRRYTQLNADLAVAQRREFRDSCGAGRRSTNCALRNTVPRFGGFSGSDGHCRRTESSR